MTSGFVLAYSSTALMFQRMWSKQLKLRWQRLVEVLVLPQRRRPQRPVLGPRAVNLKAMILILLP